MSLFMALIMSCVGWNLVHSPAFLIPSPHRSSFLKETLDSLFRFSFFFMLTKENIRSQSAFETGILSKALANLERVGYFLLVWTFDQKDSVLVYSDRNLSVSLLSRLITSVIHSLTLVAHSVKWYALWAALDTCSERLQSLVVQYTHNIWNSWDTHFSCILFATAFTFYYYVSQLSPVIL